jgi:hypothetical protein
LLREHPDQRCTEAAELILLDQLVQIHAEQFEDETKMLAMNEGVLQSQKVVVVILVHLLVQLQVVSGRCLASEWSTDQIKDRDLHHALIEVGGSVFDDFHGNYLLRLQVLTLHNLAKRALPENIEDEVPISATCKFPIISSGLLYTYLCPDSSDPKMSLT